MSGVEVDAPAVLAEAWRRSQVLDGWQHGPRRHAPLVLPESLPAPIPSWQAEAEQKVVSE